MEIRTILVPIDFGESTSALLDRAIELAAQLSSKIVLVHVWQSPVYGFPVGISVPATDLGKAIEGSARRALDDLVVERREGGVEIEGMLRTGAPWQQILEAAKETGADLIAMSTSGRKGLPRALLGSVAEKVVRMSSLPVLTFRIEESA